MSYQIIPIPAFTDNYIWCLHNDEFAVVVDPGDAEATKQYLSAHNITLTDILITHHHPDHTGGIIELKKQYQDAEVYGPKDSNIKGITIPVSENDSIHLPTITAEFQVLSVPGHTLDHIAFYNATQLFCGDTLFSAGCGRMFEGTPPMFLNSLDKLAKLTPQTSVYCTHEYTLANLAFALEVDATNKTLQQYYENIKLRRKRAEVSLPTTIEEQLAINPFLRTDDQEIRNYFKQNMNLTLSDRVTTFAALRSMKDAY